MASVVEYLKLQQSDNTKSNTERDFHAAGNRPCDLDQEDSRSTRFLP